MDPFETISEVFIETRRIALEQAIAACEKERVSDPDNADDDTYNRAIGHCVDAIRGLMA
jgi:hypothetical protein